jgi:nicotinamide mononucleotide (NMN) deamidase PncC
MSGLKKLACRALALAKNKGLSIVTAESCTAGKLSALLSEAPGAAEHLHGSFVTYTKENKTRALDSQATANPASPPPHCLTAPATGKPSTHHRALQS